MSDQHILVAEVIIGLLVFASLVMGRRMYIRIGNVHAELQPNGGNSIKDKVDKMHNHAKEVVAKVDALHDRTIIMEQTVKKLDAEYDRQQGER